MSSRSFVTPLIVSVLVALATSVTFTTAGSSSAPLTRGVERLERMATPAEATSPPGLLIGDDMTEPSAAKLSRAFPRWTIDRVPGRQGLVPSLRRHKHAHRGVPPVVVIALGPDAQTRRPHRLQYAVDMLPARTTVVLQSGADPGSVRRVVDRRPRTCEVPWRKRAQPRRAALVRVVADCTGDDRAGRSR